MPQTELDEIELQITRVRADRFTIQLRARQANRDTEQVLPPAPFKIPQKLAGLEDPEMYGRLLGAVVFEDRRISNKMHQVAGTGRAQALRLRILSDEPEIQNLRWETLFFEDQPLFQRRICLSRFLSPDFALEPPPPRSSLKALIFVSNPRNLENKPDPDRSPADAPPTDRPKLARIDTVRERQLAERSLGAAAGPLTRPLTRIDPPEFLGSPEAGTLTGLMAKLEEGFDILYLICHGSIGLGYPCLYFADPAGGIAPVNAATDLAPKVASLKRPPRLIVLASCQSAGPQTYGKAEPTVASKNLTALGPLLAAKGIPAVIAMQGFITIETAQTFSRRLFAELCVDGQVDRAVAEARASAFNQGRKDYWMPVLFSSSRSGCLFHPRRGG
ncbi:MAG TPA: CHAT domain-containing protein [Bryobacteraceae bacterium]